MYCPVCCHKTKENCSNLSAKNINIVFKDQCPCSIHRSQLNFKAVTKGIVCSVKITSQNAQAEYCPTSFKNQDQNTAVCLQRTYVTFHLLNLVRPDLPTEPTSWILWRQKGEIKNQISNKLMLEFEPHNTNALSWIRQIIDNSPEFEIWGFGCLNGITKFVSITTPLSTDIAVPKDHGRKPNILKVFSRSGS